MNSKYLSAIGATILVMALLFFSDKKETVKHGEADEAAGAVAVQKKNFSIAAAVPKVVSSDATTAPAVAITEVRQINELVLKQFSIHLKAMAKCLGLSALQSVGEKTEPTAENLLMNLRSSLGEVTVKVEDWAQTEFIDQGAVRKRVRVDYDYPDGVTPNRRLSMYQINSYGMPEIINLSADEMNNPNEAYISSLTEGHDVVTVENGARAYFSDGEELIFSVRNGQLQSVSINKADRSFNCFNLDEENSNCTCP